MATARKPTARQRRQAQLDKLNEMSLELDAVRARLRTDEKRKKELEAEILLIQPEGGIELKDVNLSISETWRLDNEAIERDFPVTEYPDLYKLSVDTAQVRAHISAVQLRKSYERCSFSPKIGLK